MGTKRQHFVPRVYLKAWESPVVNSQDPKKYFDGVYVYNKDSTLGEGLSSKAVLWMPHLYSITFSDKYLIKTCHHVRKEFVAEIDRLMAEEFKKRVYAKYGYSIIKNKKSIEKYIFDIENWEFYFEDGRLANKTGILNRISSIHSYILEDSFNKTYETYWEDLLNSFIDAVHNGKPYKYGSSERIIDFDIADRFFGFFFMMLCRNPSFDAMKIYTSIKERLLNPICSINDDDTSSSDAALRILWLHELYRMLFSNTKGFYNNIINKSYSSLQMVLFEAYDNEGTFITSDNPAFEYISYVESSNLNGFYFPLTPKHLLFICRGDADINVIDFRFAKQHLIKTFNSIIKQNSKNITIGIDRDLNNSI